MNCFNHPDKPAIGICKSCGKGLCPECTAELPNGLACRNRCEERVELINRIIDSNQRILATGNANLRATGVFVLVLGLLFLLPGVVTLCTSSKPSDSLFFFFAGIPFTLYGLFRLLKKSWYYPTK